MHPPSVTHTRTHVLLRDSNVRFCPDVSAPDGARKASSALSLANGSSLQQNGTSGFQRKRLQAPTLAELGSSDSDVSVYKGTLPKKNANIASMQESEWRYIHITLKVSVISSNAYSYVGLRNIHVITFSNAVFSTQDYKMNPGITTANMMLITPSKAILFSVFYNC